MYILPLFVVIPLGGAFLISLLGKRMKAIPDSLGFICTGSLFLFSLFSVFLTSNMEVIVYKVGGWVPPIGICMVLDGLTSFMLVTLNLVSFLVAIYSVSYMERYTDKWKFYVLFFLMLAGMNGIVVTGDLFNLFVFLEIASISSYALVAFGTEEEELEASFKYAIMGSVASSFILLGIALLYSIAATLNMADISLEIAKLQSSSRILKFIIVLFIMGFGLKAALIPFHAWLPDAHPSAPAPISAMLSGVLIKVLGVYALIRIFFNVIGTDKTILSILIILGIISMIMGAFLAIGQKDMKRMLAYSSISQIGYIIFAIGIQTPLAIFAGLFHLINHAVFKSLLFLNSGAVEYSADTRNLDEMGGLNNRLIITGHTSLIGSMSISGIPPLSGFWSKLLIILAAVQAKYVGLAIVAILVSILTLAYYLRLQRDAFFGRLNERLKAIKEVPWTMQVSMLILAFVCIFGGLMLIPFLRPFLHNAADALLEGRNYAGLVLGAVK
ncbi:MAG: NADH/ubiquinone/plastoquinone (complex I) [Candidatus Omnitrophica bacterium]|nr:NADH/ubiquinone/plastoquinone (complex I) [Candidatus Omnitrophota bacterium]